MMSSDMKDARWGLAYHYAKLEDKSYEDYIYPEWQALLDTAQAELDQYPGDIPFWAGEFRGEPENPLSKPQ